MGKEKNTTTQHMADKMGMDDREFRPTGAKLICILHYMNNSSARSGWKREVEAPTKAQKFKLVTETGRRVASGAW